MQLNQKDLPVIRVLYEDESLVLNVTDLALDFCYVELNVDNY